MPTRGGRWRHYSVAYFCQEWGQPGHINAQSVFGVVAHFHRLAVVYRGASMESFAGAVLIFLFPALSDSFVEVGAGIFLRFNFISKGGLLLTRNHNYRTRGLSKAVYIYLQAMHMLVEDPSYCCGMKREEKV